MLVSGRVFKMPPNSSNFVLAPLSETSFSKARLWTCKLLSWKKCQTLKDLLLSLWSLFVTMIPNPKNLHIFHMSGSKWWILILIIYTHHPNFQSLPPNQPPSVAMKSLRFLQGLGRFRDSPWWLHCLSEGGDLLKGETPRTWETTWFIGIEGQEITSRLESFQSLFFGLGHWLWDSDTLETWNHTLSHHISSSLDVCPYL